MRAGRVKGGGGPKGIAGGKCVGHWCRTLQTREQRHGHGGVGGRAHLQPQLMARWGKRTMLMARWGRRTKAAKRTHMPHGVEFHFC